MPVNVTSATCEYGLALDEHGGCIATLASFDHTSYTITRYAYGAAGLLALCTASYKLRLALQYDGTRLQQYSFALCMYAAATFVLRAIDPKSYGHVFPFAITNFLSYTCTDALLTVYILSLTYWICLIRNTSPGAKPMTVRVFECVSITSIWTFDIVATMTAFQDKGFGGIKTDVQLYVSASILAVVSFTFLVYGVRILYHLSIIEKIAIMQRSLTDQADSDRSVNYSRHHQSMASEMSQVMPILPRARQRPSWRIYKVLIFTETISIATIVGQVYVAHSRQKEPWKELECANGFNCRDLRVHPQLLHCFQYACLWIILWVFRKTEENNHQDNAITQA